MNLNQPYYIEPRLGENHISLDGEWQFLWKDKQTEDIASLCFEHKTTLPTSLYYSLHEAGILPHPYLGTNSKQFGWVDEKVWYYKKTFTLDRNKEDLNAFLCFEGISYYARVWINGHLLGEHEGMFGGPVCDVYEFLNFVGENEIVVEVRACNFGKKDGYDPRNTNGKNREIIPWNTARDTLSGGDDFIIVGIWNSVRLELVKKIHISRTYIYTKSIEGKFAKLHFEMQITDEKKSELTDELKCFDYLRAKIKEGRKVTAEIKISDGKECVYTSSEDVALNDFHPTGLEEIVDRYSLALFYQKEIEIKSPKLWYPVGLGEPFLYNAEITLSMDGRILDTHTFNFGIRTFSADYTKGNRYSAQGGKFLFNINGKEFFLMGMNWMPIDFLYDISPERYEWCLSLVKNAGIQLLRIWNGGGMPETDTFYELCDRMGIMVWQDQYISNTNNTQNLPADVLKSQCAYNLFRIRNHPSLVVVCGGNEFDPYSANNAVSMAVTEQTARMLTPDRDYRNASPDGGSAHIYLDMEPVWYRHGYSHIPLVAESGIHSFPNHKTLKKFISEKEANGMLTNLSSDSFRDDFPDLLNHFVEFVPERVPRMTSRISQIIDMKKSSLADVCEAAQVQAYEFYQLMIQSMRESYPVCGGVMPWSFKRPWPTVGIQLVDGDDRPCYSYYAVQNAFRSINICWCQEWSVVKAGEELSLKVKVFNQNNEDLADSEITLTIYNPDLSIYKEFKSSYNEECDFRSFSVPEEFLGNCFIVCADISLEGKSLSRSVYFNKCSDIFSDIETYKKYRSEPSVNLYFANGPFLKENIASAKRAELAVTIASRGTDGRYGFADVIIKNTSSCVAFPVTIDMADENRRIFLSDNFFLLYPGEEKTVRITCDKGEVKDVIISCWNGGEILVKK